MKTVCIILGTVSLALGIIGIFLPLLPTTPLDVYKRQVRLQRSDAGQKGTETESQRREIKEKE